MSIRTFAGVGAVVLTMMTAGGAPMAGNSGTSENSKERRAKQITLTKLGTYASGFFDQAAAEIAAYDPDTHRVFVVNVALARIDVLDISNPTFPFRLFFIDITPYGSNPNSVAVSKGIVGVAVEASPKTDPGKAVFFDTDGTFVSAVTVGALPDMITFTPNGRMALVANEGEPNNEYTIDPEGSVSIINLRRGADTLTDADVTTAGFGSFDKDDLDPSIRIFGPGASVAQDLEPEYIAVSRDSRTAWVTLQENNALGIIDLRRKRVTKIVPLGVKKHFRPGQGLDPSDQDGGVRINPWPVYGMYQPDAIARFEHKGKPYLVTANEGDVREYDGFNEAGIESRRVSSLVLDPAAFPDGATLKQNAQLGRLNVTSSTGDWESDGDFDQLFAFGGRSFSIWTGEGSLVFDSGDALEQITAAAFPANFNASNTSNTLDNRSDDKGPEPEGLTIGKLFGRTYAFIALERMGGIVIYDVSDPFKPEFVEYVNNRVFSGSPAAGTAGDLGPEGVIFVDAESSPIGKPLLIVANEVSGTTTVYEVHRK